jgi:glycosyltransferase involved in cell wall biosynthesis
MKINWFSPLPPAKTDIAHYTTRVLPALSALADVTLWTDQREWDRALEKQAEVRTISLGRMPWPDLNRADANFYQIGNNPLFHGSSWQISRLHAGVVVLHDFRLHHFFDGLFRIQWRDLNSYLGEMEKYYGAEGRRDGAECFRNDARNISYMAERYPLTRLAIENALGVVVHTQESYDALAADLPCPLALAPLPFAANAPRKDRLAPGPGESSKRVGPPFRLIVFGYIGRNRRLSSLLQALASLPERANFLLDIYGDVLDDGDQLRAQIRELGLKRQVTLHGFTAETKLDAALSRSHLAINLRFPTMGEASGSQLRIWAHRLPTLVSRVGWYATLPAAAVAFVRTDENEVSDIQTHLRSLASDPDNFAAMGERGRRELEEKHAPAQYARTIVEMAEFSQKFRARIAASKLAERAGMLLSEWLGPNSISEAGANIAKEIFALGENVPGRGKA